MGKPSPATESIQPHPVSLAGLELLREPLLNKGSAFTQEERQAFGLTGLIPHSEVPMDKQVERVYKHFSRLQDDFDKYIALSSLQDRNEHLFYRMLQDHLEEFMPIVYTPTVGLATQKFSHLFRRGRGIWITPAQRGAMREQLQRIAEQRDVKLIVVTDGESILGIGDQGAGGMAISIGKLALYSAGAGIHPGNTLPVCLDFGTNNPLLLEDEYYLGWPESRLQGDAYNELLEEFVSAVEDVFPGCMIQWEDFRKDNALNIMERYQNRVPSFNDDIQGTGAVALAGLLSSLRNSDARLCDQRVVILGAGAAGIGIARQLRTAMKLTDANCDPVIAVLDSRGLITESGLSTDSYKRELAWNEQQLARFGLAADDKHDLMAVVSAIKPHVLIGTSGQSGAFTEQVVKQMAAQVAKPVIMPFSNPTSLSEATPKSLYKWTDGQCLVATGSPFDPVEHEGKTFQIGQGNNVFVFPGLGLAAVAGSITVINEKQIYAAALALSNCVTDDELQAGLLFPSVSRLHEVSLVVARAVMRQAIADGVSDITEDQVNGLLDATSWNPQYLPYVRTDSQSPA